MNFILVAFKRIASKWKKVPTRQLSADSAYATLYLVISSFPLLIFITSVLRYTAIDQTALLSVIQYYIPEVLYPFFAESIYELYEKSDIALLSASAFITLWSASRGMYGIARGLNSIYECMETRRYWKRKLTSIIHTFVFAIMLAVSLGLLVFGKYLQGAITTAVPFLSDITLHVINLRAIIAALLLVLFFMVLYTALPNRKGYFLREFPGACFASLGWMIFSFLFSFYINHFSNYDYLYGSLTAVVLLIIWLYICMHFLFLGAQINMWIQKGV